VLSAGKYQNKAGTPSLIRVFLSVLSYSPKATKQQHTVSIDTKTLLRIEEAKLHLEFKGKSQNTSVDGLRRKLSVAYFEFRLIGGLARV
jgi:hypothetical protein